MIIDVHSHIISPEIVRRSPMPASLGDIEGAIEAKQDAGIDLTIVGSPSGASTMVPADCVDGYQRPFDQLRSYHDWLGGTVRQYSDNLRAYAYCDIYADEKSLESTAEILKDPAFVGIIANFSGAEGYLDSPRCDDFFAMLAQVKVPVLLHAGPTPACGNGVTDYGMLEMVARSCDATLGLAAIVLSGRLEQYPDLKFISSGSGGSSAMLADRLDFAWKPRHWDDWLAEQRSSAKKSDLPSGPPPRLGVGGRTKTAPSAMVRKLYMDTTADGPELHVANLRVFGASNILFGTDAPPMPTVFRDKVASIRELPISIEEQERIFSGNALEMFQIESVEAAASV